MLKLAPNYYHCFLGNGLDAVLIGPTGSMVADKVGVDYCNWYKSDRYYPEDRLVKVAGRWPDDQPLVHAEGSGWYEVAPHGRTWYSLYQGENRLTLQASQQHFVPHEGTLHSTLDYGAVKGKVVTWIHPTLSLLVERYTFDQEVEFQAWLGPGVWVEDGWDTDPFYSVTMREDGPEGSYDLGAVQGTLAMRLDLPTKACGAEGRDRWITVCGRQITKYVAIADSRQGPLDSAYIDHAIAPGYARLESELLEFWRNYFAASAIHIPDEQFQYFYECSMYHMKAMQNPVSGGLPVNNLRRTWSSHVFWDAYFLQRALLEANHRHEALESCRFFKRTQEAAHRHARDEFGCVGLKWDWEVTHDGRKAYGALLHQKYQIHNNASHANQLWGYYTYTQDLAALRELYPILEGLAQFYLNCVVQHTERGYEIGYQVGVHERPEKVRNDGINLAGTIVILRHCANAAALLGVETEFTRQCATTADELMKIQYMLYNGRYFMASEDEDKLNMSSLGPIYPMRVIAGLDPRSINTAQAFAEHYKGRAIGHGGSEYGFPWAAGVLGAIFALQGNGNAAWATIETARPAICIHGGMTEVMENGKWNMQYFGTAEAAVATALHNLLLQPRDDEIHLFPALPSGWHSQEVSFENLLALGLNVSARRHETGAVVCVIHNPTDAALTRTIVFADHPEKITVEPGQQRRLSWPQ